MAKSMRFKDGGGNYSSKGFVKDCMYEIGERKESVKSPGNFMRPVMGPGLTKPLNMWEATIANEFVDSEAKPIQQTMQQKMNMSGGSENPVSKPIVAAPPIMPATTPTPAVPKPGVNDILIALEKVQFDIESKIRQQPARQQNPDQKDLLLSELLKLDFDFMNIKLIKADGKVSLVIIMDGTEPLSINSADVSAKSVVEAITAAFTEQAMIISSIKDFRKRTVELLAAKEKEAKAAATATLAAAKPAAGNGAVAPSAKGSRKSAQEKAVAGQAAPPIADPNDIDEAEVVGDPEDADFTEERASNGITSEVEDFQLT